MDLALLLPPGLADRSVNALWRSMEMGSRGGDPANVLLIVSLQNCIRNWPMVGLDTVSGSRASSRFSVRKASYASRVL